MSYEGYEWNIGLAGMRADDDQAERVKPVPIPYPSEGESAWLQFRVASTLHDVLRAWRLVYESYRHIEIVRPNVHHIHTNPHAASPAAAIFFGELGGQIQTTFTAIHDSDAGLPLDAVYPTELATLRREGRQLSEIGLFADRRESIGRCVTALLELNRLAFHYTHRSDATSIVIGVHPHHAGFYKRLFGFEAAGDVRTYSAANGKPVVLMHLPLRERLTVTPVPRGIAYFLERPLAEGEFRSRYHFPPEALQAPPLSAFRYDVDRASPAH